MMCIVVLDVATSVDPSDIDNFLNNVTWAICSTYHTVLKATPGTATFGWNMLFNISFIVDWKNVEDYRQHQTDHNTAHEN
jgi:hypothetical protein